MGSEEGPFRHSPDAGLFLHAEDQCQKMDGLRDWNTALAMILQPRLIFRLLEFSQPSTFDWCGRPEAHQF